MCVCPREIVFRAFSPPKGFQISGGCPASCWEYEGCSAFSLFLPSFFTVYVLLLASSCYFVVIPRSVLGFFQMYFFSLTTMSEGVFSAFFLFNKLILLPFLLWFFIVWENNTDPIENVVVINALIIQFTYSPCHVVTFSRFHTIQALRLSIR